MTTQPLKYALVSLAAATHLLACSMARSPDDDEVEVEAEADSAEIACFKGGITCKPPTTAGSKGYHVGGFANVVYDPGPKQGPAIPCDGPGPGGTGPMGDPATYRPLKKPGDDAVRCWSSHLVEVKEGTIPWGFTALSLYICPSQYPVNRCNQFNQCFCWSY